MRTTPEQDPDFTNWRIRRAYQGYCRRHKLPQSPDSFNLFAIDHDRNIDNWRYWLRLIMMYLIGGLRAGLAFFLFYLAYLALGWIGVAGVIAVGAADQLWFHHKHGRWLMDDDWMKGDDFFWWR